MKGAMRRVETEGVYVSMCVWGGGGMRVCMCLCVWGGDEDEGAGVGRV